MLKFSPNKNKHGSFLGNARERIWFINTVLRDSDAAEHGGLVWALLILHLWGCVSFQMALVEGSQRGPLHPTRALSETMWSFLETSTHTCSSTYISSSSPNTNGDKLNEPHEVLKRLCSLGSKISILLCIAEKVSLGSCNVYVEIPPLGAIIHASRSSGGVNLLIGGIFVFIPDIM